MGDVVGALVGAQVLVVALQQGAEGERRHLDLEAHRLADLVELVAQAEVVALAIDEEDRYRLAGVAHRVEGATTGSSRDGRVRAGEESLAAARPEQADGTEADPKGPGTRQEATATEVVVRCDVHDSPLMWN